MDHDRIAWLTNIRAVAVFAMIIVHVSNPILDGFGTLPNSTWWIGNIYEGAARFCVPIFLMLSGALLFSKDYTPSDFFRKRLLRVIFPFLFWSLVYLIYYLSSSYQQDYSMNLIQLGEFAFLKFKNGAAFHLWYIYLIIGLCLFFPIINKWIRNSTEKEVLYFIGVWIITCAFHLPIIHKVIPSIELRYFSGYIGYPILGYYLAIKIFKSSIRRIAFCLFLVGTAITILGTFFMASYKGSFYNTFYVYLTPNVIMASIGFFLIFKHSTFSNSRVLSLLEFISRYSYGIYLAHLLILILLSTIGIDWSFMNPIVGIPITSCLCLFISAGLIYLLNKIPYVKYLAG